MEKTIKKQSMDSIEYDKLTELLIDYMIIEYFLGKGVGLHHPDLLETKIKLRLESIFKIIEYVRIEQNNLVVNYKNINGGYSLLKKDISNSLVPIEY